MRFRNAFVASAHPIVVDKHNVRVENCHLLLLGIYRVRPRLRRFIPLLATIRDVKAFAEWRSAQPTPMRAMPATTSIIEKETP